MKLILTEKDINLTKSKDGFSYRIKDVKVENIPTKKLALESAERNLKKLIKHFLK